MFARLALSCFLFLLCLRGRSQDTLTVTPATGSIQAGIYCSVLEDPAGSITISDLLNNYNRSFKPITTPVPLFAKQESYVWVRLHLLNRTNNNLWIGIENPVTDTIRFYQTEAGRVKAAKLSGDKVPLSLRDVASNRILFRVPPAVAAQTIYIRLNIRLPRQFPIYVSSANSFVENESRVFFISGIFYGLIGVIILYNLFLWFAIRDRAYGLYILYLFFSGLLMMHFDGIAYAYLWPASPWINDHPAVLSAIPILFAILFVADFLDLKRNKPLLLRGLWLFAAGMLFSCLVSIAGYKFLALTVCQSLAFAAALYFFLVGLITYKQGYTPARYYMASWTALITGVLVFLAKDMGWIMYNDFTANSIKIGIGAEAVLIAFALADRINFYKREHLDAVRGRLRAESELRTASEALSDFTENLKEKNRLIEQFRDDLERLELKMKGAADDRDQQDAIEKLGRSVILTEDDWIRFKQLFDKAHTGYIRKLKERYPQLTESDIRLITLMKLQLNQTEMANMLGVTTEAVRKSRLRLRKKLELETDQQLIKELL